MIKVIFLDIDGVMNSELFYRARHKRRWLKPRTYYWKIISKVKWIFNGFKDKPTSFADYKPPKNHETFEYKFKRLKEETDPLKWKWLSEMCNEKGYNICISSVWKNHFKDPNDWDKALRKLGFKHGIFAGITGTRRTLRGTEIQEWIEEAQIVEDYAILDDDSDMLESQLKRFYLIDPYYGLTPNHIYRIKRHLK